MKISSLEVNDFAPIKHLKMENLGNVVIIAGANGSGKTRLKQAIIQTLQNPMGPMISMNIEATNKQEEKKYFNGDYIEVKNGISSPELNRYIQSRKYVSSSYVGSLVQIDSNRNVETLKYNTVNWLGGDPDDVETTETYYFSPFSNRWADFMNYIHQKSAARDKKLADALKSNPEKTGEDILKHNPDPLDKYKKAFATLLPNKKLQDITPATPRAFHYVDNDSKPLPFSSLSSGEQEVVKVVFDVIRKDIKDSIIIVDEPELHLHPTLTFKLVETLKAIGDNSNQFIFLTHSADLISTYYSTGDVYFIDSTQTGANQAHKLKDLEHSHHALIQLMGQNLGLFAVGKKLVFIEGENSSSDRLTYNAVAEQIIPEAKVIPVGGVSSVLMLNEVEEQIRNSIFGVDLYMIRDRDGLNSSQIASLELNGRLKCLKKRHIENYFLDAEILYLVAQKLYLTETNPSLTQNVIEDSLIRIANETLVFNLYKNFNEYLALNIGFKKPSIRGVDKKDAITVKTEIVGGVNSELSRFSGELTQPIVSAWLDAEETRLNNLLSTDAWKDEFQGKIIFKRLCSEVLKDDETRIKKAYVDVALKNNASVLQDIIDIFKSFK